MLSVGGLLILLVFLAIFYPPMLPIESVSKWTVRPLTFVEPQTQEKTVKTFIALACVLTMAGCFEEGRTAAQKPPDESKPLTPAEALGEVQIGCETVKEKLWLCSNRDCSGSQEISLPKTGKFVLESHLATQSDKFGSDQKRLFPKNVKEGIELHLEESCQVLKAIDEKTDCKKVYATKYHKEWTPPEGGKAGQGSVGDLKPTATEEALSGNMMWDKDSKPTPGTKFLVTFKDKAVVIAMGYETGPRDIKKWLGGLQGEVFYLLGATSNDQITIARLKDQSQKLGPISCPKP